MCAYCNRKRATLYDALFSLCSFCLETEKLDRKLKSQPSKHFLFSKTSSRRLQRNTFRLPRRLQDVSKTYLQYVFLKLLQDVFARRLAIMSPRRICNMSSRRFGRQKNVILKTSSRRLSTSSPRQMFGGKLVVSRHQWLSYNFFVLQLDYKLYTITNSLSKALQEKKMLAI